jgi:hypothetical protein
MSDNLSNDEINNWLNFQLICKPEQSGKTFIMIQFIIKGLTEPMDDKEIVNFVLCDNNLLLTKQTSMRIDNDLKEYYCEGTTTYIEFSSHKRSDYNHTSKVFEAIVSGAIRNIICCTNGTRMNDINELINKINRCGFTSGKFHFRIWLDEADKFINYIDNTLCPITKEHSNVNVHLITATPKPLFLKFKYMNVLPIQNTTSELYHGWKDNDIHIIDKECDILTFIVHILNIVAPEEINPGTKWLIPGLNSKKSHKEIKKICINKGMAVIIINSDGITITIPETLEVFKYDKDDEFNHTMIKLYEYHHLERFPLAITGNICIGRGITIMSDDFMLDYAILSNSSDQCQASQLAGRVKGNIKGFTNYKPIKVFTTNEFDNIAFDFEQKSRNLAKLAFEKQQKGEETIIDKIEFNTCNKEYKYIIHPELFDTFDFAKNFLKTKEAEMGSRVRISKGNSIHISPQGYSLTSKLLKPGQKVSDLSDNDIITLEKAKQISASRCISATNKGSKYLILPVYENEHSHPDSVRFQVRYLDTLN